MPIGPSYADMVRDYHSEDKEQQLARMRAEGWDPNNPTQAPVPQQAAQPEVAQQQGVPAWDRTAFRDAWMGSGIQNVPDMQNWLRSSGWGSHVGLGGSKGDVMQLPTGENIDAVLAAGLGGNRGGPQWTGRGSWAGGYTPFNQMPQGQMPQNTGYGGGIGGGWGQQGGYAWGNQQNPQPGMSYLMGGMRGGQQDPRFQTMMQNQQHQQFQRGMQQRRQPNYYQNTQQRGQMQQPRLTTPGRAAGGIGPTRQPMYY